MNTQTPLTSFEFTEEMKGYLSPKAEAFDEGYEKGKQDGNYFKLHLTIRTEDLDTFLSSDDHQCEAIGYLEGDLIGGRCEIDKGIFNLFVDTADKNHRQMKYRLFFTTSLDKKFTLLAIGTIF